VARSPQVPSAPHSVASMNANASTPLDRTAGISSDRLLWPRAVMATLLLLILSLTVQLVDITWFDGPEHAPALAQAPAAPQSSASR
jgi:hypothetical protein